MNTPKEMSKRQARREQMRREAMRGRLIGIGLMTLGALAVAFLIIWPNVKSIGEIAAAEPISRPDVDFNAVGDPNAPIRIDEYSDFQCPYCARFVSDTEPALVETYVTDGTVYFVYHSFGDFIGPESTAAAEAAYCAGDQGKFWEMHDTIFANWNGENAGAFSDRRLLAFAETLGLDMDTFRTCFNNESYAELITQDGRDGLAAGIKATPSFVLTYTVNGEVKTKLIEGAQPFEIFQQEIQAALAEMGQ
jgi:protein-disulfide isomerase